MQRFSLPPHLCLALYEDEDRQWKPSQPYHSASLYNLMHLFLSHNIHTILHPTFQMAVRDNVIRNNPASGVMAVSYTHLVLYITGCLRIKKLDGD